MGLFAKFKAGLAKTQAKLTHEIKRIVTRSPKLTAASLEEIEHALIAADLGLAMTTQIVAAVKHAYESQGTAGLDYLAIARAEIEKSLAGNKADLLKAPSGPTVVSIVGVNGTGKTTTSAKLAHHLQSQNKTVLLAACDTFRAAAIEQLKLWGARLKVEVIASAYGADAASVAHDAVTAALARKTDYLFIDTAGRLHTKHNLMQELHKLHRVIGKQLAGAPHEVLLVLDANTGQNAVNQVRAFDEALDVTGLVLTKLDGTAKGGVICAIAHLRSGADSKPAIPLRFIGVGEGIDDLQPFNADEFVDALLG